MRSAFFEFNVAVSGLYSARASLNTVANNIANSETKGYSRQVTLQSTSKPMAGIGGRGMVGTGSEAYGVQQIRSSYLDSRYWSQNPIKNEYTAKYTQGMLLQAIFDEGSVSDVGFTSSINSFFDKLESLSTSSNDLSYRTNFIKSAETLTTYFNDTAENLLRQQRDLNLEVQTIVNQINSIGSRIQNLNKHITNIELDGVTVANDLRDQRALLVDELSALVNVTVKETDSIGTANKKNYIIDIDGHEFINNFDMNELVCSERTFKNNPEDVDGLYDIYWKSTGEKMNITSSTLTGELKGILDFRDGNNLNSFNANVQDVYQNDDGTLTVILRNVNRNDMQQQGNIVIDGKTYAYSDFEYDSQTGTVSISIPPKSGQLTIGGKKLSYSDLQIDANGGVTLTLTPPQDNINGRLVKIGDMTLDGDVTLIRGTDDKVIGIKIEGNLDDSNQPKWFSDITNAAFNSSAVISSDTDYKGIPYYVNKLNEFVRTFAKALNEGLDRLNNQISDVTGFKNGVNLNGETGYNLFSYKIDSTYIADAYNVDLDYTKITAANFVVAKEMNDSRNLACAISENPDESDNNIPMQLFSLRHNRELFKEGEIGDFISALTTGLAIDTDQADSFDKNYTDIVSTIENQRLSVSGVDVNEEVALMIKFNQSYAAAAKLISIIDSIYDTTINRMGV